MPFLAFLLTFLAKPAAAATIYHVDGVVEVSKVSQPGWRVIRPPEMLGAGARLRTGLAAGVRISFSDGSAAQLEADSTVVLQADSEEAVVLRLEIGGLRAWAAEGSRRFAVVTSMAGMLRRGTASADFLARVLSGGQTVVEVTDGTLALEDKSGKRSQLKANERAEIDLRGLELPTAKSGPVEARVSELRRLARAEAAYELAQDRLDSGLAREAKLAEFQQGHALVDIAGNRVRLEEYVIRPQPDQFKFVALDGRSGGMDYFYYLGTFNRGLPVDLTTVVAQMPGCADRPCDYYLTEFYAGRSNGTDSISEHGVNTVAAGQIDVNGNADPADNVSSLFSSASNAYVDVSNRSVYQTVFNDYGLYLNGKLKLGLSGGSGITGHQDAIPATVTDPVSGAALTAVNAWLDPATNQLATPSPAVTFPSADLLHRQIYELYSDGSYLEWDGYGTGREGAVAAGGALNPFDLAGYRSRMLGLSYEQVVTSSHFGGRKIDLVVDPKFMVQTGLLQ